MTACDPAWAPPPPNLALANDDVHVWHVALDQPAWLHQRLVRTLGSDELRRAERFHFEQDRKRFIVAHGLLREILGRYAGIAPGQLQFAYGRYGKPALAAPRCELSLRFNLAHSDGLALIAVARGAEVGVDVERVRPIPDVEQIAERFFSAGEHAVLRALPPGQKLEAFFNCWTRKEAYVKARGDGFACCLDRFDVSLTPGEPARLLRVDADPHDTGRWFLLELTLASGYVAALAGEGDSRRPVGWRWPEYEDAGDLPGPRL